jgi:trimeric autotransporter adhesin
MGPQSPAASWELQLLPPEEIWRIAVDAPAPPAPATARATSQSATPPPAAKAKPAFRSAELIASNDLTAPIDTERPDPAQNASDVLTINGSANNGAASPFALTPAFGNNRRSAHPLYTGGIGLTWDNAAWDARSFSLTGQDTPKPAYNHAQGSATFGGPVKRFNLSLNYQWARNRNASTQSARMPTSAERAGDFSQSPMLVIDPVSGAPFPGNVVPQSRISPQAEALLRFYPMPNFGQSSTYNFQVPLIGSNNQDILQAVLDRKLNTKDQLSANVVWQRNATAAPNLFDFTDATDSSGVNASTSWMHRFDQRRYVRLGYQFSRLATRTTPYFADRENVSAETGIAGNNQDPVNWGPPQLSFATGIAGLSDGRAGDNRTQTSGASLSGYWSRRPHNLSFGGGMRRQQVNTLSQQNPRGSFAFTGAAAGSDFAGFLLGIPDTAAIAFGNADKYFRQSVYNAYVNDDWRVAPGFSVNMGIRWEYGAPVTELYGRLVNLAITPGFTAAAPVVNPVLRPDRHGLEPRAAIAWRPAGTTSLVVRAGYGIYYDTSVYQSIASRMAQQSPLSRSLSVSNTPENPLTLADGLNVTPSNTPNTFAVDPDFRVGYAQNWNVAIQRDLPGALVASATYLGIKGTRAQQEFLPNTFPTGAIDPCPACPAGFSYRTSNGNSTREAGQLQLRRRLHNGIAATAQYTFSKALDDAALGGRGQSTAVIAQNWLDLSGERGPSGFDQRHLLTLQTQYSSGMGLGGGALLSGWRAALLKEWTLSTNLALGSGLPSTPVFVAAVRGTGVTGSIRPEYTGAPLYTAPPGLFLNPAAYTAPPTGEWGNAGRDSIRGPSQFSLGASLGRVFRLSDRLNAEYRIDATNPLNRVTFLRWDTVVTSTQFGLPDSASSMRSLRASLRVRF